MTAADKAKLNSLTTGGASLSEADQKKLAAITSSDGKELTIPNGVLTYSFVKPYWALAAPTDTASAQYVSWTAARKSFPFVDGNRVYVWLQTSNNYSDVRLQASDGNYYPVVYKTNDNYAHGAVWQFTQVPCMPNGLYLLEAREPYGNMTTRFWMVHEAPYIFWLACIKRDLGLS